MDSGRKENWLAKSRQRKKEVDLRHLIYKSILKFGYEVRRLHYPEWKNARAYWESGYLKRLGFQPRTVVDVGAAYGTPPIYEAFPESFLVLIEPLREYEPYIAEILKKYKGKYFLTALGARDEKRLINIEPRYLEQSSFYHRRPLELTGDSLSQREISVTTLDGLMEKHNFQPPFGLKIDTEGSEAEVIEGASDFLKETIFAILEVTVADRFEGGYSFAELIALMSKRGFSVCDILDIGRAENSEVTFMDLVFKRT
ncbi:MAG: FkbM family methyltransferase [Ignavibacteriales bacterium]